MKHLILCLIMMMQGISFAAADNTVSLELLDEVLDKRDYYVQQKIKHINSIKSKLKSGISVTEQLGIYNQLCNEYLTMCFDSTMVYVEKASELAATMKDYNLNAECMIHRAQALATSGHFSQAVELLGDFNPSFLPEEAKIEYYKVCVWAYMAWGEYSSDRTFAPQYTKKSIHYMNSLINITPKGSNEYDYRMGERYLYHHEYNQARKYYLKALHNQPRNTRLYAQSAYALALCYQGLDDSANYRKWLINAAIADQITPLKENLALQQLALLIKTEDGDLERANKYLMYSLEDAIYYNNRLRMLEVAEKIPDIAVVYQKTVASSNRKLQIFLFCIGVLSLGLIIAIFFVIKQKKKTAQAKDALAQLNGQLKDLNMRLIDTNMSREQYVGLFMDLCVAYINKLNKFRSTVELKIKVKQYDDIMRVVNIQARPSEAELREMFFNFDTAFLRLYPDFISKFNALLMPDKTIMPKKNELLNTDLRIFALIRMGITDSHKIATLMFYSPQTIFNHRTQIRNRAVNRDTFERDVMDICSVMPE